ncbi:hypothetical protein [Telluribacter sp. SYSU D00476]|uniref:hypothetical protein n=1 Tax=Telluribacter sp. SYSU D00476 TaxID=2811430 RepID=UPI001FF16AA7|nr:hypothetical protein [Telluribacter sp. SYSU D00476]
MKKNIHALLWTLLWLHFLIGQVVHGQVTEVDTSSKSTPTAPTFREYSVGIDVFKNIPFWLQGNKAPVIEYANGTQRNRGIYEVTFRKRIDRYYHLTGLLGYTHLTINYPSGVEEANQINGWYLKAGRERATGDRQRTHFGILGIVTFCQYRTDLRYAGPTYGDYTERRLVNNIGVGAEPYFAFDFFPQSRWMLRWVTRLNYHYRLFGEGYTPYYPGIGIAGGYHFTMSAGTSLQLHYQFRGR